MKHEEVNICDLNPCPDPTGINFRGGSDQAGRRVYVKKQNIPGLAPKGAEVTTHMVATDSNGRSIMCVDIVFNVQTLTNLTKPRVW